MALDLPPAAVRFNS